MLKAGGMAFPNGFQDAFPRSKKVENIGQNTYIVVLYFFCMEKQSKKNNRQPLGERSPFPILWGIILLAFVVVSFTGMTPVGSFLTYSFAFLFGAFFPVVLILIAIVAMLLIFRGKVLEKGNRLFLVGFFLVLFAMLALGSFNLVSAMATNDFTQFLPTYLDSVEAFSKTPFVVENYARFGGLGGGFIGTFLFALFTSFMTNIGSTALFVVLLLVGLALVLAKPIHDLILLYRGKKARKVEYTSPYQDKNLLSGKKEKEPEIDPELSKPFSDSWYRDPAPTMGVLSAKRHAQKLEEENPLLPKRSQFTESSFLKGFALEDEEEEGEKLPEEAPSPKETLKEESPEKESPFRLKSRRKKNEKNAKKALEKVEKTQEEEPLVKENREEEELRNYDDVPEAPSFGLVDRHPDLDVTKESFQTTEPEPEVEKEEEAKEDSVPDEKILETVPVFKAEPELVPEEEMPQEETEPLVKPDKPLDVPKKELSSDLEKKASDLAEDFHRSSLEDSQTFEVLEEEKTSSPAPEKEDPLLVQAKALKNKKVIEDHPHEFAVDGVVPQEEEPVQAEQPTEEDLEQRYFEIRRKKIEEEQERKRQEEEARKAKVYQYVSPNGRHYDYALPDDTLLEERDDSDKLIVNNESAQEKARIINKVFNDFHIQGKAISFTIGASVTRFNIQMEPGVKSEKINSVLSELQIALNGDKSVRIETVVEGRTTSGIEIGNAAPMAVSFKEAFQEVEKHPESNLLLPIGKDISGQIITFPLDEMPHLLVAGTTGSGKSVLVHSFIMTLIMRNYPSQLKLMLIDPKQVEFAKYNLESHLYCPVISDPDSAILALHKLCEEMDRRYGVLKQWGCVKMSEYRNKRKGREDQMEEIPDVVCVIDEFAELMQTAGSEVAETVQRISQKARAAGIYLIIATQRPSKDVIPMVIKSNIACRIGLSCSTSVDSRVILDENGAETLLGRGDLLFRNPRKKSLIRAQSPYISNEDMDKVLAYIKANAGDPNYDPEFLDLEVKNDDPTNGKMEGEGDLYEDIKDFVMKTGICSKSALIRNFSISYSKADQFIARLRNEGIVQAIQGGKNIVIQRIPMEA